MMWRVLSGYLFELYDLMSFIDLRFQYSVEVELHDKVNFYALDIVL